MKYSNLHFISIKHNFSQKIFAVIDNDFFTLKNSFTKQGYPNSSIELIYVSVTEWYFLAR